MDWWHQAMTWTHFYQTRSAWSVDQGSNKNHSPAYNFAPTVTKFCVMWEGLSLPHDTKFGNCRCKIVDSRLFPSWSLIHGLRWSGLIKVGPGPVSTNFYHNIWCHQAEMSSPFSVKNYHHLKSIASINSLAPRKHTSNFISTIFDSL